MWPQKKGLGAQLTYGVDGNGVSVISDTTGPSQRVDEVVIKHPKLNLNQINRANTNHIRLVEPHPDSASEFQSSYSKEKYGDDTHLSPWQRKSNQQASCYLVPEETLLVNDISSGPLDSVSTYDPSYGKTVEFFYLRNKQVLRPEPKVVAYNSGATGNVLNVKFVTIKETVLDNDLEINVPQVSSRGGTILLGETIKQIVPLQIESSLFRVDDILVVRTNNSVYIINCIYSNNETNPIHLEVVHVLNTSVLKGYDFVDIQVFYELEKLIKILLVDIKGNATLVHLNEVYRIIMHPLKFDDSIYSSDPLELSNWRKSVWPKRHYIYIASRSSLLQVRLWPYQVTKVITADTWSKIRDIVVPDTPRKQKYLFILTSREIIWNRVDSNMEKLLSWKHFLDDSDPSFKMEVHAETTQNAFICLVYSQSTPLVISFTFGFVDGAPYCLSSPSLIHLQGSRIPIQCLSLVEINKEFFVRDRRQVIKRQTRTIQHKGKVYGVFDLRANLEMGLNILSDKPIKLPDKEKCLDFPRLLGTVESNTIRPYNGLYFSKLGRKQLLPFVQSIVSTKSKTSDGIQTIQNFAYKLGQGVDTMNEIINSSNKRKQPSYCSLLDISKEIPSTVGPISEFDGMFEQLIGFYNENDITVTSLLKHYLKSFQMGLNIKNNDISITQLFEVLSKEYFSKKPIKLQNRPLSLQQFCILLAASLLKARSPNLLSYWKHASEEEYDKACPTTRYIVDDWDSIPEDLPTQVDNFVSQEGEISSSVPSINISSKVSSDSQSKLKSNSKSKTKSKSKSKSKSKPSDMRRNVLMSQSQTSQSVFPSSQESSSQLSDDSQSSSQTSLPSSFSSTFKPSQKRSQPSQSSQRTKKKKKRGFG